ncbi:hypothetical protein BD779DRAFT_1476898 [Infundibulicybe gibba]|nr:hypothetical protein BD779DRAFT_1476898 [Infundibulicybe gibba]
MLNMNSMKFRALLCAGYILQTHECLGLGGFYGRSAVFVFEVHAQQDTVTSSMARTPVLEGWIINTVHFGWSSTRPPVYTVLSILRHYPLIFSVPSVIGRLGAIGAFSVASVVIGLGALQEPGCYSTLVVKQYSWIVHHHHEEWRARTSFDHFFAQYFYLSTNIGAFIGQIAMIWRESRWSRRGLEAWLIYNQLGGDLTSQTYGLPDDRSPNMDPVASVIFIPIRGKISPGLRRMDMNFSVLTITAGPATGATARSGLHSYIQKADN